jgi:site-specific DNA-methyltransferase (adenine-specific)
MDADPKTLELDKDAPRRSMQRLVLPGVELYCGDSLDIAPTLQGVDALISDPPYGMGYFHGGNVKGGTETLQGGNPKTARAKAYAGAGAMIIGDDKPFDPTPWLQYPSVILWGGNHFSDKLPKNPKWLIWDKIVVPETYGKFSFADCEMAWTNQKGTARIYKQLWQGCRRSGESNAEGKLHPNQKPIMLMQWCMEQAKVPEGATVLDPYMGSGSTIIAAIRTGRKAIGIEKDPEHFKNAVERIKRELAQGDLFHSQHNAQGLAQMPVPKDSDS